jgi:hypothetical protein
MFDIEFRVDFGQAGGLDQLVKDIKSAEAAAAREVARTILIPAMKVAMSHSGGRAPIGRLGTRTGQTRAQIKAKFWTGKDGLTNGSVKVIGDRAHIAFFNESGTQSHGKKSGPLPARKMFETVGRALRATVERAMVTAFERNMKAKGYR